MTDTSQYLYTIKPTRLQMLTEGRTSEESRILTEDFDYLEGLAVGGMVLLAGRTQENDEPTFGIVILQVDAEDAAREAMQNDLAVAGAVMYARLHPFSISIRAGRPTQE
jgi:hypothetical protein